MKLKTAVIGNDHYNTLNVVRALGREGIEVYLFVVSPTDRNFVRKSRYIKKSYTIKDEGNIENALISAYMEIGNGERIPLIATCDSVAAAVDSHLDTLSRHYILPSVAERQGALVTEMDKDRQLRHAAKAGFDVPQSVSLGLPEDIGRIKEVKSYPCLIKPETSFEASKKEFRICRDQKELGNALRELTSKVKRVLVQQFIPNDEVILIAGVRTNEGKHYIFGEVNKLKHSDDPENLGLNCLGVLLPDSPLAKLCERYTDEIDYRGCYSIEVLRTREAGKPERHSDYFLEINLRTDGLLYFYNRARINYPALWVKSCYGLDPVPEPVGKKIYGMTEFNYLRNYMGPSSLKDFLRADTFSIFSLSDLKPFIYKFIYHGK